MIYNFFLNDGTVIWCAEAAETAREVIQSRREFENNENQCPNINN